MWSPPCECQQCLQRWRRLVQYYQSWCKSDFAPWLGWYSQLEKEGRRFLRHGRRSRRNSSVQDNCCGVHLLITTHQETDKATIDVEAQDDGVLGKIIMPDGTKNVQVGKAIALLVEDGDDISSLEIPKDADEAPVEASKNKNEESPQLKTEDANAKVSKAPAESLSNPRSSSTVSSSSKSQPEAATPASTRSHGRTFPSVRRLLAESNVASSKLTGTGIRGMITKGDVLVALGKVRSPLGSYEGKQLKTEQRAHQQNGVASQGSKKHVSGFSSRSATLMSAFQVIYDGDTVRRLLVTGLLAQSSPASATSSLPPTFESIVEPYLKKPLKGSVPPSAPLLQGSSTSDYYWAGLLWYP